MRQRWSTGSTAWKPGESYFDAEAVLDYAWRKGDSIWALASDHELQTALTQVAELSARVSCSPSCSDTMLTDRRWVKPVFQSQPRINTVRAVLNNQITAAVAFESPRPYNAESAMLCRGRQLSS